MDLSKIPNSSNSPPRPATPQPPPAEVQPESALPYATTPPSRRAEDAWLEGPDAMIAAVIGLIICWFSSPFFAFLLHKTTGSPFGYTYTDTNGAPLAYTSSWFFVAHLSSALAGLAMIFEGIVLGLVRKKAAAWAVVGVMAFATLFNLGAFFYLMPRMGGQILQLLCAVFCAYAAWSLYNRLRAYASPRRVHGCCG